LELQRVSTIDDGGYGSRLAAGTTSDFADVVFKQPTAFPRLISPEVLHLVVAKRPSSWARGAAAVMRLIATSVTQNIFHSASWHDSAKQN
jgi:hypothetical protein